jgi:hypothetical protein
MSELRCPKVLEIQRGLSPQLKAIVAKVCLVCFISRIFNPAFCKAGIQVRRLRLQSRTGSPTGSRRNIQPGKRVITATPNEFQRSALANRLQRDKALIDCFITSLFSSQLLVHPTKAHFVWWRARILSLKNSRSRNPYAWRFIVLILLLVPCKGPVERGENSGVSQARQQSPGAGTLTNMSILTYIGNY